MAVKPKIISVSLPEEAVMKIHRLARRCMIDVAIYSGEALESSLMDLRDGYVKPVQVKVTIRPRIQEYLDYQLALAQGQRDIYAGFLITDFIVRRRMRIK